MKALLITLFVSLLAPQLFAQAPALQWDKTIGGSSNEFFQAMRPTPDGGNIFGGYSISRTSGEKNENSFGGYDYWVVRTAADGSIQWQKTFGGTGRDFLKDLQLTSDGGVILAGYSDSPVSGNKTVQNVPALSANLQGEANDYWVIKLDASGNIEWQQTYGGNQADIMEAIQETEDGGFILGGYSRSGISGNKTVDKIDPTTHSFFDYWIIKIDHQGAIEWQKAYGGKATEWLTHLTQTIDKGYFCSGWSASNAGGNKTQNSFGLYDYWVVKADSVGNIEWQLTIGSDDNDYLQYGGQTSDGGYILGGYSSSSVWGNKTVGTNGALDYWVVKLSPTGSIQWQKNYGGTGNDSLFFIEQTNDGGYFLSGMSASPISGDKTEATCGSSDYWMLKIDSVGNIVWDKTVGGNLEDKGVSMYKTADDGFVFGGTSKSNAACEKSQATRGGYDYWIVRLGPQAHVVSGYAFYDTDGNGQFDLGELPRQSLPITAQGALGNYTVTTDTNGYYILFLPPDSYTVSAPNLPYHNQTVPATPAYSFSFTGLSSNNPNTNFGITPQSIRKTDFEIVATSVQIPKAGFGIDYVVTVRNRGSQLDHATVSFTPDNHLICNSALTWNVSLLPGADTSSRVSCSIPASLTVGTVLSSTAAVVTQSLDVNLANNSHTPHDTIRASHAANDIEVNIDNISLVDVAAQKPLTYTIRFQNTGNAPASFVNIVDSINANMLDVSTFRVLSSSHPMSYAFRDQGVLVFIFSNINLPDSSTDEPNSHGFVRFSIAPKTSLQLGDRILNNADIYFDFNLPIRTNTAITTVAAQTTGVDGREPKALPAMVHPNPATEALNIALPNFAPGQTAAFSLYDLQGREVLHQALTDAQSQISLEGLPTGLYLYRVTGLNAVSGKLVKQ